MSAKQVWIMLSASLAILAGALTPWLLRSPQTELAIAPGIEPELPVAEFADATRLKPQTGLVGQSNLFHPGRGVVVDDPTPPTVDEPIPPQADELGISLQSIGRINTLACANLKVGAASQVVPVGSRVPGTAWQLKSVHARSATLRDGAETLVLTVGAGQ